MPNENKEREIKRLQQNLRVIRKIAGWTAETLGDKIGVTKQTISNLENEKTPMNFTQYIAIRSILDCEIKNNIENETLRNVVPILLDRSDELDDENYTQDKEAVATVAASASGGIKGAKLAALAGVLLSSCLGLATGVIVAESYYWLKKLTK